MKQKSWVWMPHPGHFICSYDCRFHLTTYIGKWIISTVGEYFPDQSVREILAKSRGIVLQGMGDARRADYMNKIGYEDIGCDRKYETMVFRAMRSSEKCCPFRMSSALELDTDAYNKPGDAYAGHLKMCKKWAKKTRP